LSVVGTIDGIIAQAVGAVLPTINADLLRRPSNLPSDRAYQRYLLARDTAYRPLTFPAACAAVAELEALISVYPTFPLPYLSLARLYNTDFACTRAGSSGPKERARSLQLAKRALALDRGQSYGYTAAGWSYLRRREWETARTHLQQALALNPFHPSRVMEVGYGMMFLGDIKQADILLNRCLLLNPAPEDGFFSDLGVLAMVQGEHERAANYFELVANPRTWGLIYAAMNARAGGFAEGDEVEAAINRISEIWPEDKPMDDEAVVGWIADHHPFRVKEAEDNFLNAARRMLAHH
jgi:tetratricopeptide (TPR) repeat protein